MTPAGSLAGVQAADGDWVPARAVRAAPRVPASFIVPGLFVIENIFGGPFGSYFGIPVRFGLFGASVFVLGYAALWRGAVAGWARPPAWSALAVLGWTFVWATLVPAALGADLGYAIAEFRPLLLLLLPSLACLASPSAEALRAAFRRLQRAVVAAACVLAVFQVAIWVAGSLAPGLQPLAYLALRRLFPGTEAFLYVGPMPDGFFRVFWISSIWLPTALFWAPAAVQGPGRRTAVRLVLLAGIFVSYSRGIWLGLAVGTAVASVAGLRPGEVGRGLARRGVALALALGILLAGAAATGQFDRVAARVASTAPKQVGMQDERVNQIAPLVRVWERSPLVGGGFGAYARDYVRVPEAPYSYENTSYALLAKLGVLGLGGVLATVAYWIRGAWRARHRAPADAPAFLGAMLTLLLASMTNPMLLNFVGMTVLATLVLQWAVLSVPALGAGPPEHRAA